MQHRLLKRWDQNPLADKKVLVVGDLMLDHYIRGEVTRISPEAPVPVLSHQNQYLSLGGAANVARNLVDLGAEVELIGVLGEDPEGATLVDLATKHSIALYPIVDLHRPTTTKMRVVAGQQQVVRVDRESTQALSEKLGSETVALVEQRLEAHDTQAIILSDYAKGFLSAAICQQIIAIAKQKAIPVFVDPKQHDFTAYRNATLVKPNRKELERALDKKIESLDILFKESRQLREKLDIQNLVVTLGERGIALSAEAVCAHEDTHAKSVFDVSGAGDTTLAILCLALISGWPIEEAAALANCGAGLVVAKAGTASLELQELRTALQQQLPKKGWLPTSQWTRARAYTEQWQEKGESVVFTNGCFDLLHVGHITLLEKAKALGNRLVVGLNTDRSVQSNKGPKRPIVNESQRARVLAALESVDLVVLFDEDDPVALVQALRPNILVKGSDYEGKWIAGGEEIKTWGGRVELIDIVDGISTSAIANRLSA